MPSLDAATDFVRRGWCPIPVPHRSKNPGYNDWEQTRLTEADLPRYFNGRPQNIGVLLGEPSGGLVDVDLDCLQAVRLAPRFLPPTGLRFGRPGKRDSHWLYECHPLVPTEKFLEVRDEVVVGEKKKRPTLVEFRSTGSQTVFPDSTHETGEPIRFCAEGAPTLIEGAVLAAHVARLAAASLLARHWPGEGSRHHAAGALAGGLARAGWPQEDIVHFVGAVAWAGDDDQVVQRERLAADTFENLTKGQHVTGWKRLIEITGKDVVVRVTKWLGIDRSAEPAEAFGGFGSSPGGGNPELWPSPQPLPAELPPVMPFHDELLPRSLRIWITDISERVQCPPDFPAIAAVVGLAAVVGRAVGIRPKRHDDWTVVPNLWGMAIGRPGIMKTPALQEPLKPLKRLEIEAQEEHHRAVREFEARAKVADAAEDVARQKLRKDIRGGANLEQLAAELADREEAEPQPVRHRFVVNDATVEKLGEILNQNPNGVLCYRDELIGLLKALDKDGQEGARAFYLEAWNGTGRYTYDRIGRGTIDIEVACISVLGATQPGPLGDYQRDAVRSGAGDDGLLQRFQVAVWPDLSKEWVNCDRWPNSAAREAAYDVFSRLASLDPVTVGAVPDEHDPKGIPFLRFDEAAQDLFDAWRADLERRVRSGDEHAAIESHLAKYRSLIPSLALLFHLADGRRGAVSAEALERAIAWGTYLETHARRIFSPTVRSAVAAAHALAKKIMAGALPSGFGLKEVYRPGWSKLADRESAEEAVDLLIDHHWLAETTEKTTGRPRSRYWINPRLGVPGVGADAKGASGGTAETAERVAPPPSGSFGSSAGEVFGDYEGDERTGAGRGGHVTVAPAPVAKPPPTVLPKPPKGSAATFWRFWQFVPNGVLAFAGGGAATLPDVPPTLPHVASVAWIRRTGQPGPSAPAPAAATRSAPDAPDPWSPRHWRRR